MTAFAFGEAAKPAANTNSFWKKLGDFLSGAAQARENINPDDTWKERTALDAEAIRQAAARIDSVAAKVQEKRKVTPLPRASDEVFVRRAYLDLGGRIPTLAERDRFMAESDPGKRAALILRLVQSEDYVNHSYNYWAGLLRIQTRMGGNPMTNYITWVKNAIRDNMPYDTFVRKLVTATGESTPDNGATGFAIRDFQQGILDHVSQISTVFLGSQIGCAMCHNAKFEKWKQTDFYALTAYFSEVSIYKDPYVMRKLREQEVAASGSPQEVGKLRRQMNEYPFTVADKGGQEQHLPKDYKYDPSMAGGVIDPGVLYGEAPEEKRNENRRQTFARWLTAPENPNFTRSVANRLWANMFGLALIQPVDDLSDNNAPSSAEMMNEITSLMISLKYNLKAFTAAIAMSESWQRATSPDMTGHDNFAFESHPLRRLSAEQIWDSLLVLALGDRLRPQAPVAMNAENGQGMAMNTSMNSASANNSQMSGQTMSPAPQMQMGQMGMEEGKYRKGHWDRGQGFMSLSSEQIQPPQTGGFLEQFGAPMRDIVSVGSAEPSIAQTLTLMNGRETTRFSGPM
ncbi:MAG: DUF1549 domain-containing protein, partial [Spirochaetia bacterium]|nr:DUF1549 domain-containing protein [Spirochaetia bacterium]